MKFLVATLFILFFSSSTCFSECEEMVTQSRALTFSVVTRGVAGQYIIYPNDLHAAVLSVKQTSEGTVTPSIRNNTGQICKDDSPSTCLTVSSHTITAGHPIDNNFVAYVGGTVTVLADSPAGFYTGFPSTAVFTCE